VERKKHLGQLSARALVNEARGTGWISREQVELQAKARKVDTSTTFVDTSDIDHS
jgi:hypothetical protein